MSGDRAAIFGRIREALQSPAPQHFKKESHAPKSLAAGAARVTTPFRQWLPTVGEKWEEQHALFSRQCAALKAEVHDCADMAEAARKIAELTVSSGWKKIALHGGELTEAALATVPKEVERLNVDGGYEKLALEACDAGISACECLIAQTGSVCVTALSSGGRALSVLPPHHLVIARRSQLLPDLTAAFDLLAARYGSKHPSFISFITGPSRTGDIERILVLGAHGPKRLSIFIVP